MVNYLIIIIIFFSFSFWHFLKIISSYEANPSSLFQHILTNVCTPMSLSYLLFCSPSSLHLRSAITLMIFICSSLILGASLFPTNKHTPILHKDYPYDPLTHTHPSHFPATPLSRIGLLHKQTYTQPYHIHVHSFHTHPLPPSLHTNTQDCHNLLSFPFADWCLSFTILNSCLVFVPHFPI